MSDSEPASASSSGSGTDSGGSGDGSGPALDAGRHKWVVFLIVAVLSLIADQATKIWARESLPVVRIRGGDAACVVPDDLARAAAPTRPGQAEDLRPACAGRAVPVIDGFWEWRLSMNPGSAFGLFSNS